MIFFLSEQQADVRTYRTTELQQIYYADPNLTDDATGSEAGGVKVDFRVLHMLRAPFCRGLHALHTEGGNTACPWLD